MKKREPFAVRLILFVLSIVAPAFASLMLSSVFEYFQSEYIFACVCTFLLYFAITLPILLGSIKGGITAVAVGGAVYYSRLSAIATGLDNGSNIRTSVEKIVENMQYLSASNSTEAHDLEYKMLTV